MVSPIPGSAAKVRRVSGVGGRVNTSSVLEIVTLETGQAVASSLVESVAVELTATQRPFALKKLLAEHSVHVTPVQILQRRLLLGTTDVSVLTTHFPS